MPKYSLILSPNTSQNTKIDIYELCLNGNSVFHSFIEKIEEDGSAFSDLAGAIRNLEHAADRRSLPQKKFREIKGQKIDGKLYEAKCGSVRIYHFHEKYTGRIIVLGGLKGNQKKDIRATVRKIKAYQDEKSK